MSTPNKSRSKSKFMAKMSASEQATLTPNARIIIRLMAEKGIKGHYKDYAVITGVRVLDWRASYDLYAPDGRKIGTDTVLLIHKSLMHRLVGDEIAKHFWRPGIGRVGVKHVGGKAILG